MRTLLNILWNIPGLGFVAAFFWLLAGCLTAITIILLPWSGACFMMASYSLAPFGRDLVPKQEVLGHPTIGSGDLGLVANILWFVIAGVWLAILHLAAAIACAVTIIGLPFAWAHFKLAAAAIAPVGKMLVPSEVAHRLDDEARAGVWLGRR